ncbi:MAG: hypothetical protein L0K30_04755, partial [Acidipropionibacterium jensenii]|nr:hypothetical protein [Acidipropionibacterium jensenii]
MTTSAAHDSPVIRACGRTAFLVELPTLAEVLALHAELIAHQLSGQMEVLAAGGGPQRGAPPPAAPPPPGADAGRR